MVILRLALIPSDNHQRLLVEVTDTGIGIDDSQKERVLEAFAQVSSSFNRRFEGVGLGLTICHHISQIVGGTLRIEDNDKQGTRVIVELPVEVVDDPDG